MRVNLLDSAVIVRTLDNGLRVAMEPLPYLRSVSAGMWIRTGSANETDDIAGISHLLEHLFFKGTETRSAHDLMDAVESRGGHMNAFTSRDYTCIYVKTLDEHIGSGVEILGDVIKHSVFADLEKERNVIIEEIASSEDVPEEYVHDLLTLKIWPNHALGRPIAGSIESVGRIRLDDIRAYRDQRYTPANMVFSIAGNFDVEAVFDLVRREFESLPAGGDVNAYEPPECASGVEHFARDIAQHHIAFGFPAAGVEDDRRFAFELMSGCIGGGSTSRLFERIREDEGLAYSIYSFQSSYIRAGVFGVYAAVAPENLEKTLDLCFEELRKARDADLNDNEIESNREQLKGSILMSLESTFNRMARMGRSLLYYDRILDLQEIVERVDAVTRDEIAGLAAETFRQSNCAMTVLGPNHNNAPTIAL